MILPLLSRQTFGFRCMVLYLKLKKMIYSLKENAAGTLKVPILYWIVQCYIFIIRKKKEKHISKLTDEYSVESARLYLESFY